MNKAYIIYRENGTLHNYSKTNLLVVMSEERAEAKVKELNELALRYEGANAEYVSGALFVGWNDKVRCLIEKYDLPKAPPYKGAKASDLIDACFDWEQIEMEDE